MIVVAMVFVGLAALIHCYIFVLESLRWSAPSTRKVFGIRSQEQADAMKLLAFNQGFYNLWLALIAIAGIIMVATGNPIGGAAVMVAGAGAMVLAGLVLFVSERMLWRAALIQAVPPAVGLVILIGLAFA